MTQMPRNTPPRNGLTKEWWMLHDTQNSPDDRNIAINEVGICDLKHPVVVMDRSQVRQQTVATFSMSVDLPADVKGTHMSRFVEVLNKHHDHVAMDRMPDILTEMREHLEAETAFLHVKFPYFVERTAPQSGMKAVMDYECEYIGRADSKAQDCHLIVTVPVKTLCPCSKLISDYGAHNQRGYVTMDVESVRNEHGQPKMIWIEELIQIAEESGSAPLYPLLKRPDERHVTMQAYENPVFVEDVIRNVAKRLKDDVRVASFRIKVVNHESIHNHNAFACIEWARQPAAKKPVNGSTASHEPLPAS